MSYTTLISFTVAAGRERQFEEAFAGSGMLTLPRAVPGYLGAELHRSLDDPSRYVVLGRWATQDAYRAWQRISLEGRRPCGARPIARHPHRAATA